MGKMYSGGAEKHHGIVKDGNFVTSYGKDDSDVNMKRARVEDIPFKGGVDNVEHSLGATKGQPAKRPSKNST